MLHELPPIYFYIPQTSSQANLPTSFQEYWQWQVSRGANAADRYFWTLQTYLRLHDAGFPCELATTLPEAGIVVSHRHCLPDDLQPQSNLLIVCLQADKGRHPYAQLHVVQNPRQQVRKRFLSLWESYFIPHWIQPELLPRDPKRGNLFQNIAFFGFEHNLVHELRQPSWVEFLQALGLKWCVIGGIDRWHDYREIDVVLAVRSFGYSWDHTWKPATKLYNCWHAGVPAILGRESAFQAERKNELDYLEVGSYQELIQKIKLLQANPELRRAMIEQGRVRAGETCPEKMLKRWQDFLVDVAVPAYHSWCSISTAEQQRFLQRRRSAFHLYTTQRRFKFLAAKAQATLRQRNFMGQNYRDL
jgi:hypothetical protein